MVKTTYIIPKSKYFPIEVKYINDFNKLIYNSLQLAQNIDNQKTVNVLRLAFEASRGKFGYVSLEDTIIVQIQYYNRDQRMLTAYFDEIKKIYKLNNYIEYECGDVRSEFISAIDKYKQA